MPPLSLIEELKQKVKIATFKMQLNFHQNVLRKIKLKYSIANCMRSENYGNFIYKRMYS